MTLLQLTMVVVPVTTAALLMTLPLITTMLLLKTNDKKVSNEYYPYHSTVVVVVHTTLLHGGPTHLTMISRQTRELGKPVLNPGQHPFPIFLTGNEGPLTGTHIPAFRKQLTPTAGKQTRQSHGHLIHTNYGFRLKLHGHPLHAFPSSCCADVTPCSLQGTK